GLGATFCCLLTGREAYYAAHKAGHLPEIQKHAPATTGPLRSLLARLTHAAPEQRPSAGQTRDELRRMAAQLGIVVDPQRSG
ncbi:MAG: hypothetical protein JSS02_27255, partial [Planctomycetes bacterium]|nr:hypothetical protein [Planctomycetota bacterium]